MRKYERPLSEHLAARGPKRLLALDGGGIRGIFTLQYLKRLETMLRERYDDESLLLCDYFDLIGGTSTGSIIAAGLAFGNDVDFLIGQYNELGQQIFGESKQKRGLFGLFAPKFSKTNLRRSLEKHFNASLGSDAVKTGLMVMCRRADTGSPWALHNVPTGKYYSAPPGANWIANKDFLVKNLISASAAAPTYFEPEEIEVGINPDGSPETGIFVDGGISPFNNPALQLLMLATLEGYGLTWPMGQDRIQLTSIGTAFRPVTLKSTKGSPLVHAVTNLTGLMDDCDALSRTVLQWLGHSPTAVSIDSELGDLQGDTVGDDKHLTYLRYNITLEHRWMLSELGISRPDDQWKHLAAMDEPANLRALAELGKQSAEAQLLPEHFTAAFDLVLPGV